MAVVVLLGVGLGWFGWKLREAERQRRAVEAIEEAGGVVFYDYEFDRYGNFLPSQEPPIPTWLRELVSEDCFSEVVVVTFVEPAKASKVGDMVFEDLKVLKELGVLGLDDTHVTDAGLKDIRILKELGTLGLDDTHITDVGLENLEGLTNLEYLDLTGTQVSDEGLQHLKGLAKLEHLDLSDTHVTPQGIKELQEALPNCLIDWEPRTPKTNLDQP